MELKLLFRLHIRFKQWKWSYRWRKKSANIYSEELAQKDIEYAKQNSNYIIAIMHWGDVNSSEISEYQRNITAFLVENGVDMILGSHPSVVEPMEIIQTEEGKMY